MTRLALHTNYDVTVIGGGIHGAGIAQAAAAAGYKVLLLEKSDWAAGTSSKSSKLIHGGLRYLQSGQFRLVRESIRERELLLKIAPELVRRNDFYIPLYKDSHYKSWQLRLGLSLYALFGGCYKSCRYKKLTTTQYQQLKGLKTDALEHVFCYPDAQTDDALLTRAVIASANKLGAHTLAPARLDSAQQVGGGYTLSFRWQDKQQQVISRVVINAAGPWANRVNGLASPSPPSIGVDLVQGTHLILAGQVSDQCYYLEAPQDQRAVFLLPWYGNTLLGTTETLFEGDPDSVEPQPDEAAYLLSVLQHYFPDFDVEVLDAFAGLRVLPRHSSSPFKRSRETQLVGDKAKFSQWISVYGGKLTGYRATAEKVVKLIRKSIGPRIKIADTRKLLLKPDDATGHQRSLQASPQSQPDGSEVQHASGQNAG